MNVAVLGSGIVATTLAAGLIKHGHTVTLGTRDPAKLADFLQQHPAARAASVAHAAQSAELIILAVKGTASAAVLRAAGAASLAGKTVIDATNPITDEPPENGALRFFTGPNDSLMEQLQREFPAANLVKAFNSVGSALMINPTLPGGPPTMFICGNNPAAKTTVTKLLTQFGWETADMGPATSARALEPLCILWCLPGFLHNQWTHAFKLLKTP